MKSLIKAVAVAAVVAVPALSFAQSVQSNQPLTRAEVRSQLEQLEQAGYRPNANDPYYPNDLQAAEARVAQQNGQTGYGPATSGSSQSGGRSDGAASSYSPPVYQGH